MNSENLNRTIEGATVQGPADDNDNSPMANEKLLSFSTCPDEYKMFIEETSLEKLVYWKLFNLFEKFDEDSPNDILKTVLAHVERPLFALVLKKTKGNQSKAADVLGCNRNTLHRKLKEFSIEPRDLRRALRSSDHSTQRNTFTAKSEEISL
ncbi:helix-turn-helix domain-containing protein [Pigmentibacter sp. JX0631]|uniref:helix-turn-helix domain-containing protein n=1 Tax=Pigmentibacter sp. JX0631 TaxID=2976982 RepID=UPI0024690C2A|nr:helix-turn-helix domain-containing protein [Pigmentibacter sp. JX0631]WGL58553.1 helix-turn-helix domain-containing protein [Pigmentibacter sp. JX0631]